MAGPVLAQSLDDRIDGPPPPDPPATISRDTVGHATVRGMRLPSPISVDGQLDEAFYRDVPPFGDFIQMEPFGGQPATEKTDVWVFFDEANVYISARLWESDPSKRVTSDMRRDANNMFSNDHFGFLLDTFYDWSG